LIGKPKGGNETYEDTGSIARDGDSRNLAVPVKAGMLNEHLASHYPAHG
jgi:hypothetical protein